MMKKAYLVLENGVSFQGKVPSTQKSLPSGEVVFTTGMTGYVESLTDPSYAGQLLAFTFPLIGNYGVPRREDWESYKAHLSGVIVTHAIEKFSHPEALYSLSEWLASQGVPLITGIDTRALTKILRTKGTLLGAITEEPSRPQTFEDPSKMHLVSKVSLKEKQIYGSGKKRVIAVDCGIKESMLHQLASFSLEVVRVPFDYDYSNDEYDGVFLSNGPGDPETCVETIAILKKALLRKKPIFGVCLGSQLMALASGAKTMRLKFGHRGHNQPCMDLKTNRCYITSQNHGYAVDEKTLPDGWEVSFRNLNDRSVEGIRHKTDPFFAVQFHPEACPGPTDTRFLFDRFYQCL
jgi:carbamoyl-phosphate synthase small subunit